MPNPNIEAEHTKLVELLPTSGWELETESKVSPIKGRTLEEVVRMSHARHKKGETPGFIRRIEDAFEVDLMAIEELWAHLGLPL